VIGGEESGPRTHDATTSLTPGGHQLARYLSSTLSLVGQCRHAVDEGDWVSLANLAGCLSLAADELSAAASLVTTEATPTGPLALRAAMEALACREE